MKSYLKAILCYIFIQVFGGTMAYTILQALDLQLSEVAELFWMNMGVNLTLLLLTLRCLFSSLKEEHQRVRGETFVWSKVFKSIALLLGFHVLWNMGLIFMGVEQLESENQQLAEQLILQYPLGMGLLAIVVAPIVEELIFRLALINWTPSKFKPVWMSALIFGFVHVSSGDFFHMIPYVVSGLILGRAYVQTKQIRYPIAIHVLNNIIATLLV